MNCRHRFAEQDRVAIGIGDQKGSLAPDRHVERADHVDMLLFHDAGESGQVTGLELEHQRRRPLDHRILFLFWLLNEKDLRSAGINSGEKVTILIELVFHLEV